LKVCSKKNSDLYYVFVEVMKAKWVRAGHFKIWCCNQRCIM